MCISWCTNWISYSIVSNVSVYVLFNCVWCVPNNLSWCCSLCIGQHLRPRIVCFRNLAGQRHRAAGAHLQPPSVEPLKEARTFIGVLEATSSGIHRIPVRWSTSSVTTRFNRWLDVDVYSNFMSVCSVLKANANTNPRISCQVLYVCYLQFNDYCGRTHFGCTLTYQVGSTLCGKYNVWPLSEMF